MAHDIMLLHQSGYPHSYIVSSVIMRTDKRIHAVLFRLLVEATRHKVYDNEDMKQGAINSFESEHGVVCIMYSEV